MLLLLVRNVIVWVSAVHRCPELIQRCPHQTTHPMHLMCRASACIVLLLQWYDLFFNCTQWYILFVHSTHCGAATVHIYMLFSVPIDLSLLF